MHRWRRLPAEARPCWPTRPLAVRLAIVVALAASLLAVTTPATGQDDARVTPAEIVTITSAATAGVYTVGWQTLGGCDPKSRA